MDALTPGTYYQDILADGSRSKLRQNFKHLRRVTFDTKAAVVQTLQIEVTSIPLPELVLTPAQQVMVDLVESPTLSKALTAIMEEATKELQLTTDLERLFKKVEEESTSL